MTDNYLPKSATIEQACDWLSAKTGEEWMLPRLLECGLMPWFWLDYSPEAPAEIFGGRTEGYFAPMIFTGDTHRLEMDGASVIVTMSYTYDEKLVTMNPGMRMPLSELRFRREDLEKLAGECKTDSTAETMKTLFHKELCDREFGSAVVATSELRAWAATQGLQLRTVPSLDEFDHVQIEALLCAVERAVAKTYSSDDALEIIRHRPDLMEHRIAAMAVKECFAGPDVIWLLGADAHKQWRTKIGEAIDAGDLTLLDPASLLPIEATRTRAARLAGKDIMGM